MAQLVNKDVFIPNYSISGNGVISVTTNATVKMNGELVMGRGAARDAARKYMQIPQEAGRRILLLRNNGMMAYGFQMLTIPALMMPGFGIFQVKHFFYDKASLDLIKKSTEMLAAFALGLPHWYFNLNYPGIGNGGLAEEQVWPIVKWLPDNVYICRR